LKTHTGFGQLNKLLHKGAWNGNEMFAIHS
jgi:hypothetical protein